MYYMMSVNVYKFTKHLTIIICTSSIYLCQMFLKIHENGFKEFDLGGSLPGVNHIVFIVGNIGEQKVWEYAELTMPYDDKVFEKPTNVTMTRMTGKTFALCWEPPVYTNRPFKGYCVSAKNLSVGGSVTEYRFLGPEIRQFSFTYLEVCSVYNLAVCAWDGVNVGPREYTTVTPEKYLTTSEPTPKDLKYNCLWCDLEAHNLETLRKHCKRKHGKNNGTIGSILCEVNECQQKNIKFYSMKSLLFHMKTVHDMFKCKSKEEEIAFRNYAHGRLMEAKMPYLCEICKKTFNLKSSLKQHIKRHHEDKNHSCEICPKKFVNLWMLDRHMLTHTGEKPYKCSVCRKAFSDPSNCQKHEKLHYNVKSFPFECEYCQRTFSRRGNWFSHTRAHTADKAYKCNICHKTFKRNASLKTHIIRLHSGKTVYRCIFCGKGFINRCRLYTHILTHLHEKIYFCTKCNSSFTQKNYLKTHIKTHR